MGASIREWLMHRLCPRFCVFCQREGSWLCEDCKDKSFSSRTSYFPRRPEAGVGAPTSTFAKASVDKSAAERRSCLFCRKESEQGRTCENCRAEMFLDGCVAMGSYAEPPLRQMIQIWKFHGDKEAAGILQNWMKKSAIDALLPSVDAVLSLPLHAARLRERGYNQADCASTWIAHALGVPVLSILTRKEWTNPQARQDASNRRVGMLDGAFVVTGFVPDRVLICDDVATSGATLDAAARALKEAGAKEVWAFVWAIS